MGRRCRTATSPRPRNKPPPTPETLGGETFVVKAQIHAGGRGKGGGIKLVKTLQELHAEADRMLGQAARSRRRPGPRAGWCAASISSRTRPSRASFISRCWSIAVTGRVAFVASTEGGVNIEEVAANTPEKIVTLTVDPATGVSAFHGRVIASALKLEGDLAKQCAALIKALYTTVRREGREPDRDQPAGRDQGGQSALPRRQDRLRRQRAVPPCRHRRVARHPRRGPRRGRGRQARSVLCEARRLDRLHGQRRRPRHGHHGHHQALWRRACQLPRCRRRRDQGAGDRGVQDHPLRPAM